MLFRSFAHWLLLIFGAFVFVVSLFVAASMHLLGDAAYTWIIWAASEFDRLYGPNKGPIDLAVKATGAVGTALGAAWTVHKGWHYAERNLPMRLAEFNDRWRREIEAEIPVRIPALADGISIAIEPVVSPSRPARFLGWIYDRGHWDLDRSRQLARGYRDDFNLLTTSRVRCQAQLVSALLNVAANLSRAGKGDEALIEFENALNANGADVHALEATARQAFALGQTDLSRKHLKKLARLSSKSGDVLRRTRAMRFEAEVLKGDEPAEARDLLKAVIEILRDTSVRNEKAKSFELCLAYAQLADVQLTRSVLFAARTALNRARELLGRLDPEAQRRVGAWLDNIDARLRLAEIDRDKDHDEKVETPEDQPPSSNTPEPADCSSETERDR